MKSHVLLSFLIVCFTVSRVSGVRQLEANEYENVHVVDLQYKPDSGYANAQSHVPGDHDYIKVEVEVVQLLNPQGLLADGQKCDSTNECDPKITVYLDTDKPLMAWPGGVAVPEFTEFFKASNKNSPVIYKNASKNICGGSVNKVNLRAHIVDDDTFSSKDLIDDFECIFAVDYNRVARSVASSDWSATEDCRPQHQNNQARLQYRFRAYDIPQSDCGIRTLASRT